MDKDELEILEETIAALAGSSDERALEAYKERLAAPTLTRCLH